MVPKLYRPDTVLFNVRSLHINILNMGKMGDLNVLGVSRMQMNVSGVCTDPELSNSG